jgi:hypothetical protein
MGTLGSIIWGMVIMILGDLFAQLLLQLFQLRQPFGVFLDLRLDGLGLRLLGGILFGLTHQHAHLLGKAVAGGAQVAGLGDGRRLFCRSSSRTSSTSGSLSSWNFF